jgi:hypothetical protein
MRMPPVTVDEPGLRAGFGLDESDHEVPFQISIRVIPNPMPGNPADPAATQNDALTHDTE